MAARAEPATTVVLWGGLDPGGQAGLAADLQAAQALGAQTRIVVTALTAQTNGQWFGSWPTRNAVRSQTVRHLELPTQTLAIKSGMLATRAHANALARFAQRHPHAPLVVDPLLAASAGGSMWPREDVATLAPWLLRKLLPHARLVTPNWPELAWLTGQPIADRHDAERLLQTLPCAAVLKGGHAPESLRGVDLVWDGTAITALPPASVWQKSPRGTGCRMATAIAVGLARGDNLLEATVAAKALVAQLSQVVPHA